MVDHYEIHVMFQDIEHQIQEYFLHFFHYSFSNEIFIKLRSVYLIHSKLCTGVFCDIAQEYQLFTSQ